MANTLTSRLLVDDATRTVQYVGVKGDGTGEQTFVIHDCGALKANKFRIRRIRGCSVGCTATIAFDHSTDDYVMNTPDGVYFDLDWKNHGGLIDPDSSGGYGDLTLTTIGLGSGDALWVMVESEKIGTPAVTEPVNTVSLMHFDGLDAATTYVDTVTKNTLSRLSASELDTADKKFGSASLKATTSNDGATNIFAYPIFPGTDWTIEMWWAKADVTVAGQCELYFYSDLATASSVMQYQIRVASTTPSTYDLLVYLVTHANGDILINDQSLLSQGTLVNSTWYHMAIVREGNTVSVYFDGSRIARYTVTENNSIFTGCLVRGDTNTWMDEARVSRIARYSGATYTVPTAAFSVD